MKYRIYSVYDTAAAIYQRPFVAQTDGEVTRSFSDIATSADHEIGKHPEDYTLFCLGTFNDGTGDIMPLPPVKIATALELVALSRNVKRDQIEALDIKLTDTTPDDAA